MTTQATPFEATASQYAISNTAEIFSPGLVIFRDLLEHNLEWMVRIAGGPEFLRPHAKTHKIREIVRMWLARGVTSHKCATIAEAEMLALEKATDIMIAYQMVGPNISRLIQLIEKFPEAQFSTLIDHPVAAEMLGQAAATCGLVVDVWLDLNPGMNRTGVHPDQKGSDLYELISTTAGLRAAGLHWYDGHHRQSDVDERRAQVLLGWEQLIKFRDGLLLDGFLVPSIVAAGTGSFPILAQTGEPSLELSPGTTVFFDADVAERFPEMPFVPALGILTRVVSLHGENRLTLDVGHKSCAADQPAGKRLWFPDIPDAVELQHTEEHLVIESSMAAGFTLGSALIAIPRHVCPAVAVHQAAHVVSKNHVVDTWQIAARDRKLTV